MPPSLIYRRAPLAFILLSLALAAGCGKDADKKKAEDAKKAATQVAAKVNSDEITIHQVNQVLARTPNLKPEGGEQAKRDILERLIDQQIARQKAIEKKLDRSPAVQLAIEAAKSEILARAYLEQVAAAQPKPTPEDVKKYYAEHPELFSERRVYNLEELAFVVTEEQGAQLRESAARAKSLKEIADWLQAQGIRFAPNRGVRAAEQIPLELLPRLQKTKDGDIVVIESGPRRQVIRVVASQSDPVDLAKATPAIERFLGNRRAGEAIVEDRKALRAGAKIQYMGEFAEAASAAELKAKAAAKAKAEAEANAKAKADAEAQARSEEATKARQAAEAKARQESEAKARAAAAKPALPQQTIDKGVKGLQ